MGRKHSIDLDVEEIEDVPIVLNRAARFYLDSADEISTDAGSAAAGKPWRVVADEISKASERITNRLARLAEES